MQVVVQYVNPPKNNMSFGSIKTTDGVYLSVEASDLYRYGEGMVFDVEPEVKISKGRKYLWIPEGFDPNLTSGQPAQRSNAFNSQRNDDFPESTDVRAPVRHTPVNTNPVKSYSAPTAAGAQSPPGFVSDIAKQGYIAVSVLTKILVDATLHSGEPVTTENIGAFAARAVEVWNDQIKGKV